MKKAMKSISFLLTIMFLITGICVVPTAAADVTYSVTPTIGETGEIVTVSVYVSTTIDLWGSNVQLKYNPAELQVVSYATGGAVSNGSINDTGSSVNFSGMFGAKSGTVFTVSFRILKESGKSSLTLSSSENTDFDGETHDFAVSNGYITVFNKVPAEKITLDKTSVKLEKGDTTKIVATVSPSNTTDNGVVFYSSDDDIATVSDDGTITAVKGGTATITALAGEKAAKCKVTVTVAQTGIKANGSTSRNAVVGDKINLSVVKVPADATDVDTAKWTTSNPNVATVLSNGTVTAVAPGEATITAKVNNWIVAYKITVTEKTDESTTTEQSTTDESTTVEESTTEESTTDVFVTEPTTFPIFTTEPTTREDFSLVEPIINENLNEDNNKYDDRYKQLLILVSAGVVVVVIGTVSFFVIKGYRGKNKKQRIIVEEKYKR